eukprot:GGOE01043689.1.p1 GENE.GGOE01043689.1~~GGOE01043689.1.p1  ORF type:complete len:461 (-),score=151.32 GGOE01043689.1:338-1669(-)
MAQRSRHWAQRAAEAATQEAEIQAQHITALAEYSHHACQRANARLAAEQIADYHTLVAEECQGFAELWGSHLAGIRQLRSCLAKREAQHSAAELAQARAAHLNAMAELDAACRNKEEGLQRLEDAATQRMAALQLEYEERRRDLQLKEAKERESHHQDALEKQLEVAAACEAARVELQQLRDNLAREQEMHRQEVNRQRALLDEERRAEEHRTAVRRMADEERRKMEQQQLQRLEEEGKRSLELEAGKLRAQMDKAQQALNEQLAFAHQQCQLYAVAFWELGRAVGAEDGEWEQLMQLERDWHPVAGAKWRQERMERLLHKEEGQRERMALRERDMRQELFDLMREERRQVENAIRERRARNQRKVTALGRIRSKGVAGDIARDNVSTWAVTSSKLPPLADVAGLLNATAKPDPREMAAYKSYFTLQMREVMKPLEPRPCSLP